MCTSHTTRGLAPHYLSGTVALSEPRSGFIGSSQRQPLQHEELRTVERRSDQGDTHGTANQLSLEETRINCVGEAFVLQWPSS